MDRRKNLISFLLLSAILEIVAGQVYNSSLAKNLPNNEQLFMVTPGIKMYLKHGDLSIQFSFRDFFSKTVSEGRAGGGSGPAPAGGSGGAGGGSSKKTGPLQKIIRAMMMIPFAMQVITLPGVLAEIKISLFKSLIIAKVALVMLIMNAIKMSKTKEVVVIQKLPPPQHHDHFYHPDSSEYEEENHGFFG
ncbi:uncharacterized protein LOC122500935 [Leptopilina heterotoma]|uniref:uncharacterized protein LOC122500935 n=1 Tax=Leptopilina heterotoma TaxID=63436 RepID=UPI001CA94FB6|nr:uncharacterized protein LOC122500935 [Leptopilina heterotoma]